MQAARERDRDVFHGMHRDVRAVFEQALFQLLDEQSLAADLRQAAIEDAIALGRHGDEFHLESRVMALQGIAHVMRLPQRQLAFASTEAEGFQVRFRFQSVSASSFYYIFLFLIVIPAKAGIQGVNSIARIMRDLDIFGFAGKGGRCSGAPGVGNIFLILLKAALLKCFYVLWREGEPLPTLTLIGKTAMPVFLNTFWIICFNNVHRIWFLWQLNSKFT